MKGKILIVEDQPDQRKMLNDWLVDAYQVTEADSAAALQKALGGSNQFVAPQVGAVAYEIGDSFLLCTDGLVEGLRDSQLWEFLRSPG